MSDTQAEAANLRERLPRRTIFLLGTLAALFLLRLTTHPPAVDAPIRFVLQGLGATTVWWLPGAIVFALSTIRRRPDLARYLLSLTVTAVILGIDFGGEALERGDPAHYGPAAVAPGPER